MADIVNSDKRDVAIFLEEMFEKTRNLHSGAGFDRTLGADWMETPVGEILLAGDAERLHILCFLNDDAGMVRKLALIQRRHRANMELGGCPSVSLAKRELEEYFGGRRRVFDIPLALDGSAFQLLVWRALPDIPYGHTVTYVELAEKIGKPSAFRAVAQANSQNPVNIILPCHRVINNGGGIGGYAGGVERKEQLLEFERNNMA